MLLLLSALLACAPKVAAPAPPPDFDPQTLARHATALSGDAYRGRGIFEPGLDGDAVLAIDGAASPPEALRAALTDLAPGASLALTVQRGGETLAIPIERAVVVKMGVYTGGVSPEVRAALSLPAGEGLTIRRVVPDSPAAAAGLQAGDLLLRLAGYPVTRDALRSVMERVGCAAPVTLAVVRDGEPLEKTLDFAPAAP